MPRVGFESLRIHLQFAHTTCLQQWGAQEPALPINLFIYLQRGCPDICLGAYLCMPCHSGMPGPAAGLE